MVSSSLEGKRPDWDDLLRRSGTNEPTLSPLWLLTWWRTYGQGTGRKLRVGLVHQDGRLVGLVPLLGRRVWHWPGHFRAYLAVRVRDHLPPWAEKVTGARSLWGISFQVHIHAFIFEEFCNDLFAVLNIIVIERGQVALALGAALEVSKGRLAKFG